MASEGFFQLPEESSLPKWNKRYEIYSIIMPNSIVNPIKEFVEKVNQVIKQEGNTNYEPIGQFVISPKEVFSRGIVINTESGPSKPRDENGHFYSQVFFNPTFSQAGGSKSPKKKTLKKRHSKK